jgi:uncharacterized protein YjiS (DUF1127 family)
MLKSFKRWRAEIAVQRELHALTDRELSDIGISRGEIISVSKAQ